MFHGYAHGMEIPADVSGGLFATGFILATILLHACGIGLGVLIGRTAETYRTLGYRAAGSVVALAGLLIILIRAV
jgi:urease accessory protein